MQDKNRKGEMITLYCIVGNLFLSLLKGLAGYWGGSKALIADAVNSASDTFSTVVVFFCLKIAHKPADSNHPYGHGKIEPMASAFVGIAMIIAAGLIMRDIVFSIFENDIKTPNYVALVAAVVSCVIKEIMFRITCRTGLAINSEAMISNAWDHRSDVYASAGVFFGILGSILGGRYDIEWLKYLDLLMGAIVVVLIIRIALKILVKAISNLMDASISETTIAEIVALSQQVPGVCGISWVRGRTVGSGIFIDMAVQVDSTKNVKDGHDIAAALKKTLKKSILHVEEVLVHINPHMEEG